MTSADYVAAAAAELKRRFGVPWPDGLQVPAERALAMGQTPGAFIDMLALRFELIELKHR